VGALLILVLGILLVRSLTAPLNEVMATLERLTINDSKIRITKDYKGIWRDLKEALKRLIDETTLLSQAAVEGQLTTRADVTRHHGEFGKVVLGLNATMEAVASPLGAAQAVLARLAVNDYTNAMTGAFRGDFQAFADGLNAVRDRLLGVQNVFLRMAAGDLKQASGIRKIGRRSDQDQIMPAALATADAMEGLERQILLMVKGALDGDLTLRLHGADDRLHCPEQRERQGHRRDRQEDRPGDRGRGPGGARDRHRHAADRQEDRHHRRDRLPDQPAAPECRH
jgi:methyl-accepting chemotaxis protein